MKASNFPGLAAIAAFAARATAAGALGDYIAAGLGIYSSSSTASSRSIGSFPSLVPHWNTSIITSSPTLIPSSRTPAILLASSSSTTSSAQDVINTPVPSPEISILANITHSPVLANDTHAPVNDTCWLEWEALYSIWHQEATVWTTLVPTVILGPSMSDGSTVYSYSEVTTSGTTTIYDGAHAIATRTFSTEYAVSAPFSEIVGTETIESTVTSGVWTAAWSQFTTPACSIPTLVPACQSSWDAHESEYWEHFSTVIWPTCVPQQSDNIKQTTECWNAWTSFYQAGIASSSAVPPRPLCPQASIAQSYCTSEASRLINWASQLLGTQLVHGYATTVLPDGSISTYWDSGRTLAPGCTLGCQQCKLTGSSVQMFFWPPQTSPVDPNEAPMTAVGLGTTFTSPTIYVSFDTLFASDSCSGVGGTYSNTILAIPRSADISSLWGMNYLNGFQYTASFNFEDLLQTPVPNSIYNRQPRCAEAWFLSDLPYGLDQYNCSRDYPYNPILMMPAEVKDIDPAWVNCDGGIRGVYDPPIALTPAAAIALPTFPVEITYIPHASPAPTHQSGPTQTPSASTSTSKKFQHFVFDPTENNYASPTAASDATTPSSDDLTSASSGFHGESSYHRPAPIGLSDSTEDPHSDNAYLQPTSTVPNESSDDSHVEGDHPRPATAGPNLPTQASHSANVDMSQQSSPVVMAVVSLGTQEVTAVVPDSTGVVHIGSHTLTAGQSVTLQSQVISVASSGIAVNGHFAAFSQVAPSSADPMPEPIVGAVISVDDEVVTAVEANDVIVIGSHTLSSGASTIISHHTFGYGSSGLMFDGETVPVTTAAPMTLHQQNLVAIATLGSATVTAVAASSGRVIIGSDTLRPGQSVTADGHYVVAHQSGIVIDGSQTLTFTFAPSTSVMSTTHGHGPQLFGHHNITRLPPPTSSAGIKANEPASTSRMSTGNRIQECLSVTGVALLAISAVILAL